MGGLSKDPAKAQRQRDALAAGRRRMAENLLSAGNQPKPAKRAATAPKRTAAKAPAKASKGSRASGDPDRLRYTDDDGGTRAAQSSRRPRARRQDDPPRRRGGFLAGLRGQLD